MIAWPSALHVLLLVAAGVGLYHHTHGLATLNPHQTTWLLAGDPAQHYLGWLFYRHEAWHWPPGTIANWGLPHGTSIVYTDSIPALALLLKPLNALLPAEFQYFGLWMLACYIFNGIVAWQLLRPYATQAAARLVGAFFFMLSPPLLMRGYGHEALMAHALLLLGFYGYCQRWGGVAWTALLVTASLTHPYLLLMLLAIWAAHTAHQWQKQRRPFALAAHAIASLSVVATAMYVAGYFIPGTRASAEGLGYFSMNMLALVQPNFLDPRFGYAPWWHGPDVASGGQYEGYLYLGAGMLALALAALGATLWRWRAARTPAPAPAPAPLGWLLLACLLLWCLALSPQITFGPHTVATLPLPPQLQQALSVFRASGRLGWPLYYLLMLLILRAVLRHYSPRAALALLGAALLIQWVELQPKHHALRQHIQQRLHSSMALSAPEWHRWAAHAQRLILLAPDDQLEHLYLPLAHLAARHRLATNAAHTARASASARHALLQREWHTLQQGTPHPNTLYVLADPAALPTLAPTVQQRLQHRDGYTVLPPATP